jgi:molybdate transport repressor ModE-like protein
MHFDLVDLRLFLHVAEAGSITAGAEQAGLSLASASARVRGMEEQAGASLLERGHRGVELTPAGRTLLHHARLVTGQMERMRGELGEYARGLKGHVRLLANTAAAAANAHTGARAGCRLPHGRAWGRRRRGPRSRGAAVDGRGGALPRAAGGPLGRTPSDGDRAAARHAAIACAASRGAPCGSMMESNDGWVVP